ncbi:PRTRC system protein E [Novosphingobium sp. ST904]|uniref:PRTRC system protein E n=1 Tax=Novosphingobium sp. ST904 TaxID=1684385 RepID=UPI0006C83F65|nr:PRTRC system protein E [Novosphingobium sp. ST904]KPH60468.1 PRTRC system protein E [Novosphingobium sp. ST904]TCM40074.1 PRTRC genetic system protein E [Novosphingobium sp. ST904]
MLITSLLPLLSRYSLGFDLAAGADSSVTLTIMPRKSEGAKNAPSVVELQAISITATPAEIDAELALGEAGALGQLVIARKALGDQLAEQRQQAEAAKTKAKPAPTAAKASSAPAKPEPAKAAAPEPKPGEPASLW